MLQWQIGAVTVTRVVEMDFPAPYHPKHSLLPDATPEALRTMLWLYPDFVEVDGTLKMSIHALLVEAPGLRLVVDTCIGNDKPRNLIRQQLLSTPFLARMAEAGWPRDSVNAVVCTHLHVDHVGWNTMKVGDAWVPTFPNARYLIGRVEHGYWTDSEDDSQAEIMADSVAPIFAAGLADLVEMDHRLSPEVRLMPTTGHTPGHVSVVIESQGQTAIITGDMMHHPCQIAHPEWAVRFDEDAAAAGATRHDFVRTHADAPVLIIGTHFAGPTAGHIVADGDRWKFSA
jgi:glyoxylase-like metal-dependent hydrolase (beta-lactamase superfamily II)